MKGGKFQMHEEARRNLREIKIVIQKVISRLMQEKNLVGERAMSFIF